MDFIGNFCPVHTPLVFPCLGGIYRWAWSAPAASQRPAPWSPWCPWWRRRWWRGSTCTASRRRRRPPARRAERTRPDGEDALTQAVQRNVIRHHDLKASSRVERGNRLNATSERRLPIMCDRTLLHVNTQVKHQTQGSIRMSID